MEDELVVAVYECDDDEQRRLFHMSAGELAGRIRIPVWSVASEENQSLPPTWFSVERPKNVKSIDRDCEKLYYKKQKENEQLKQKESEKHRRKRDRSESDNDTSIDYGKSKDRRKGDKALASAIDEKPDDDENFDEYLDGMFP